MSKEQLPEDFLKFVKSIEGKRSKVVIDHLLEYGEITTEDLEKKYNYKHAPRAIRDVREAGVPLITYSVKSSEGKSIAAYKFGDPTLIQANRSEGRKTFPKKFRNELYTLSPKCAICNTPYEKRYLQIDHRAPYEVAGDLGSELQASHYMLICGSCNRAKSWSCEQCENFQIIKDPVICMRCYWGSPENYNHIALEEMRRLDITWTGDSVKYYDAVKALAVKHNIELPEFIKEIISKNIR